MFDHFSKKFRIAAIRRENLEFLKSGKPNFLGLAKFAQINFWPIFEKKFRIATIWRENLEFSNFLGLAYGGYPTLKLQFT